MPQADLAGVLAAERALMNRFAKEYESNPLFNSYFYEEERARYITWVIDSLRKAGVNPFTCRVLETGQSTGNNLELLGKAGFKNLTGIDIAEDMIAQARWRVAGARFVHGSIENHSFGSERFDVILAAFTLHHMLDPRAFFAMADRILAPRGWLFLIEYDALGLSNATWSKPFVESAAFPLRRIMKLKNRRFFSKMHYTPAAFNPAHRLLSFAEILAAMGDPQRYEIDRRTRGLLLPAFNYALVKHGRSDRFLYRMLNAIDNALTPPGLGNLQWIAARRKD